jgi:hypothetical protein
LFEYRTDFQLRITPIRIACQLNANAGGWGGALVAWEQVPEEGEARFSGKIVLDQESRARWRFILI